MIIDWTSAPEGATHYRRSTDTFFKLCENKGEFWVGDWAVTLYTLKTAKDNPSDFIKRPESITDVARSIEAARVAEKSMPWPDGDPRYFETSDVPETKKYPHYFKDVSAVDAIDLYHVARLYDITDPALFHAFKKIACAGKRGAKDRAQDVQEAIDALKRWQELNV